MTTVSMIHGTNKINDGSPFSPGSVTDGELNLQLISRQLDFIKQRAYNEGNIHSYNQLSKAQGKIYDAISSGLANLSPSSFFTGFWEPEIHSVAQAINKAIPRYMPAAGVMGLVGRKDFYIGTDPIIAPQNIADCEKYILGKYGQAIDYVRYSDCRKKVQKANDDAKILNDHLEDSAHKFIYEFVTPDQHAAWNIIDPALGFKINIHKSVGNELSAYTEISRDNLVLWMYNGVLANNAKSERLNFTAFTPQETIGYLIENPQMGLYDKDGHAIGCEILCLIGIAIIIAVSGGVAISMVQTIQGKQPTAFKDVVDLLKSTTSSAMGKDFTRVAATAGTILTGSGSSKTGNTTGNTTPVANNNSSLPNWVLPVVGGATALYFLSK